MRTFILLCVIVLPLAKTSTPRISVVCGEECKTGTLTPLENESGFNKTNNSTGELKNTGLNGTEPEVIWNGTIKPIENTAGFAPLSADDKEDPKSLSSKKFDYRQFAAIPSSKPVYDIQSPDTVADVQFIDDGSGKPLLNMISEAGFVEGTGPNTDPDVEVPTPLPATSALEEMALYSNKRKLRQGRRSLETAVPT